MRPDPFREIGEAAGRHVAGIPDTAARMGQAIGEGLSREQRELERRARGRTRHAAAADEQLDRIARWEAEDERVAAEARRLEQLDDPPEDEVRDLEDRRRMLQAIDPRPR